jgi:hypothetical protein
MQNLNYSFKKNKSSTKTSSKTTIGQDQTPNSLKVDKGLTLGSSNRGLGIRNEILVGGAFIFACKRKIKGGGHCGLNNTIYQQLQKSH